VARDRSNTIGLGRTRKRRPGHKPALVRLGFFFEQEEGRRLAWAESVQVARALDAVVFIKRIEPLRKKVGISATDDSVPDPAFTQMRAGHLTQAQRRAGVAEFKMLDGESVLPHQVVKPREELGLVADAKGGAIFGQTTVQPDALVGFSRETRVFPEIRKGMGCKKGQPAHGLLLVTIGSRQMTDG
jgi:hypothetical protein